MKGKFTIKMKSIIAFFVLFILLVSSTSPILAATTEENTVKSITVNGKARSEIEMERYVNYNYDNQKGVLLQLGVKTGMDYDSKEDYLPIVASSVLTHAPQIKGKYPSSAVLFKYDTTATNGNNNSIIPVFEYDKTKGEAKATTISGISTDALEYVEGARDYYSIIFYYDADCYSNENESRTIEYSVEAEIKFPGLTRDLNYTTGANGRDTVLTNKGNIISSNIVADEIYNGFIKSNKQNETSYATNYTENVEVEILKTDIGEETAIELETLVNKDNEEKAVDGIVYKSIELNKENVLKILGENGYLKLVDDEKNTLGELNKDTQVDENGVYKLEFANDLSKVKVVISTPKEMGRLEIKVAKQILSTFDSEITKFEEVSKITATRKEEKVVEEKTESKNTISGTTTTKTEIVEKEVYTNTDKKEVEIKEAKTEVNFSIDNKTWTNKNQNEININLELLANDSKYNLFKDPNFEIQLPSEVENVYIGKEIELSNGNGLKVASASYDENTRKITVTLEGEQKEYLEKAFGNGTNIKVPVTVTLKRDIENAEKDIVLAYVNNATSETGTKQEKVKLENFNQPKEDNTETKPEENKPEEQEEQKQEPTTEEPKEENITAEGLKLTVTPVRGDKELQNEDEVYESEFIKFKISVENTTDETLKNVKIYGEVPEGTVYAKYKEEFDKLSSESSYEYNENVKKVPFVIDNLNANEKKSGYYEVKVKDLAEGLTEKTINTKILGYIDNKLADKHEITNIIKKAEYSITATAYRRDIKTVGIKLNIESKNGSDEPVLLKISPDAKLTNIICVRTYEGVDSRDLEIGKETDDRAIKTENENEWKVKPGMYYVHAEYSGANNIKTPENDYELLYSNFTINNKYKANELKVKYYFYSASITMKSEQEADEQLQKNDDIQYTIEVENTSKIDYEPTIGLEGGIIESNNYIYVNLKDYLPKEVKIEKAEYTDYKYTDKKEYKTETVTKDIPQSVTSKDGIELPSVDLYLTVPYGEKATVNLIGKVGYVEKKTKAENFATIYEFPEAKIIEGQEPSRTLSVISESNVTSNTIVPPGYTEEQEVQEEPGEPEKEITPTNPEEEPKQDDGKNQTDEGKKENQEKQDEPKSSDNGEKKSGTENENVKKYSISGLAWIDSNEDGKKQESEGKLSGVEALLVDKSNNVVANTKTTSAGKYTFDNIEEGKYIVVFKYNTTKYRLTAYHKNSVGETENSDAIDTERTINGTMTRCGVTEQLELNSNLSNIDVGLIENKTFNFKVDKYVSKVSVKTESGTKVSEYDKTKLAKTEIRAAEIEGATVLVEYRIVVTNNGEMPGKVGTVIDTLPQGFEFSSELNSSWAKNTDGTIINNSLATRVIEPGKSAELILLATKTMKGDSTGTFTNTAKITNISNEAKVQEKDVNDNTSSAELIISVSTGGVVYILSGIIGLIILVGIAILIKKNRNVNKTMKNIGFMVLVIGLIFAAPIKSIAVRYVSFNNQANGGGYSDTATGDDGNTYHCADYSINDGTSSSDAVGGTYNSYGNWTTPKTYTSSSSSGRTISNERYSPSDALSFSLSLSAQDAIMHEEGGNLVIGPIHVSKSGGSSCETFTFTVYSKSGGSYTITQGNSSGDYTLTVPLSQFETGVSSISVHSTVRYTHYWTESWTETITIGGKSGEGQPMTTTVTRSEEKHEEGYNEAGDSDTLKTCNLKILKTDEFGVDDEGNKIDLSGIHFIINTGSGNQFLETDKDGKTKSLEGLKPGKYTVYEIISGGDGSKDLPERLRDYYKASETYGGYNVKPIGSANISAGEIYTYNAENLRDYTGLQLRKIDNSKEHILEGIKFKVKDKETGKWVQWERDQKGEYIVVGLTDKYDINDEFTTLTTDQQGLTEKVKRFEVGKTYEIYEVDTGDYKYLYEIGPKNGGSEEGLLLSTWKAVAKKEGYTEITGLNNQYYGAFKIVKKMSNTKASLEGIGFKIRVRKSENDNEWKWLKLEENEEGELVVASEFVSYKDATAVYTNKDGETKDIIKAPIFTDDKENKYIYDVYEVFIPGKDPDASVDTEAPNNEEQVKDDTNELRDVLTLDLENYTRLYDIRDNEDLVKKMTPIATFELEKDIQANNKHRSVITFPTNSDDKDAVYNNQSYIKIRGNVWQEILEGKNTIKEANNIKDEKDYNIQGIIVELVNADGDVVQKTRVFEGQEEGPQKALTDENGNYLFEYVILGTGKDDKVGLLHEGYRIRFTYDGVTYESVIPYAKEDVEGKPNPITSKAAEEYKSADNRKDFNNKWQEINRDTSIDDVKLEYYELQDETNPLIKKVDLKYRDIIYHKDKKGNLVTVTGDPKFLIESYTEQGKLQKYYDVLAKEKLVAEASEQEDKILWSIDNINLGVYYRERPNLTLQKDEFMAHATVNGKEYTYVYNSKLGKELEDTGLQQEVKFDSKTQRSLPIYEADVNYGTAEGQNRNKLEATITYKIKLQNASNNLNTGINSINEYYSNKVAGYDGEYLELAEIYLVEDIPNIEKEIVGKVPEFNWTAYKLKDGDYSLEEITDVKDNKYKGQRINFTNTIKLGPAVQQEDSEPNTKYLFLTFNIKDIQQYFYAVGLAQNEIANSNIENYAEIASYTIFADNKFEDTYAGVDSTSIPGNLDISNYEETREDDSDKALGLRLVKATDRSISGIVFEDTPETEFKQNGQNRTIDGNQQVTDGRGRIVDIDNPTPDGAVNPGEERIGNGIYDADSTTNHMAKTPDTPIEGVKVTLQKVNYDEEGNEIVSPAKVWVPDAKDEKNHGKWVEVDELYKEESTSAILTTNSEGKYFIPGLPTGEFKMQFEWGTEAGGRDVRDYKSTVYTNPYATEKTGKKINIKEDWVYEEERKDPKVHYSDAIDDYDLRQAIDAKELGVSVDATIKGIMGALDTDWNKVTMKSTSPVFTIGVEEQQERQLEEQKTTYDVNDGAYVDTEEADNLSIKLENMKDESFESGKIEKGNNPWLPFDLDILDFGIIERPRQALGVEKFVRALNIKTTDDKQVAIAYFDTNGQLQTIAGEKYVTGGYDLGYLWAQIDKEIQQDMRVEIEYEIKVKNHSEIDYDDSNYYFFGAVDPSKVVKLSAENLYDYVSGSTIGEKEDRWEVVSLDDYKTEDNIKSETANDYADIYNNSKVDETVVKDKLEEELSNTKYSEKTKELFRTFAVATEENDAAKDAAEFSSRKIAGRQILKCVEGLGDDGKAKNKLVANPYLPGEQNSETLKTSKLVGVGEQLRFDNDVEITKVKLGADIKTGRKHSLRIAPLYDSAEWISITPATGGDKDYAGIIIAGIGCLTVLACGIILIKKYVGKSK